MIKSELVQRIAEHNPHLYQRDVENIVNAILDEIVAALARGDRVELRGFGAFAVKNRPAAVTARFVLAMKLDGELQRADRVRGSLFLTWSEGAWRVFGYDVTRGVVR